jgi:hypothetical protein
MIAIDRPSLFITSAFASIAMLDVVTLKAYSHQVQWLEP